MKYLLAFLAVFFVIVVIFYFIPLIRVVGFFLPMVVGNWPDPM